MDQQIDRIKQMEEDYSSCQTVLTQLEKALDAYEEVKECFDRLGSYYSTSWLKDYEDDEKGLLPAGLKRGVLSQDGLYDLLEKQKELKERCSKL